MSVGSQISINQIFYVKKPISVYQKEYNVPGDFFSKQQSAEERPALPNIQVQNTPEKSDW
jgi:hypothetical protein